MHDLQLQFRQNAFAEERADERGDRGGDDEPYDLLRESLEILRDVGRAINAEANRVDDHGRNDASGDEDLFLQPGLDQERRTKCALVTRESAEES